VPRTQRPQPPLPDTTSPHPPDAVVSFVRATALGCAIVFCRLAPICRCSTVAVLRLPDAASPPLPDAVVSFVRATALGCATALRRSNAVWPSEFRGLPTLHRHLHQMLLGVLVVRLRLDVQPPFAALRALTVVWPRSSSASRRCIATSTRCCCESCPWNRARMCDWYSDCPAPDPPVCHPVPRPVSPPQVVGATQHLSGLPSWQTVNHFHLKESTMRRGSRRNDWNRYEQAQNKLLCACFNEQAAEAASSG
jgi:hypothetical protein